MSRRSREEKVQDVVRVLSGVALEGACPRGQLSAFLGSEPFLSAKQAVRDAGGKPAVLAYQPDASSGFRVIVYDKGE